MVTPAIHTRLVGYAQMPRIIVMPETLLGDMTRIRVIVVLEISRSEIFPGIMVLAAMLIGNGRIKASLIQHTHTHHEVVAVGLCMGCHTHCSDNQT